MRLVPDRRSAALVRHLFVSSGKNAGQEKGRFLAAQATLQDEKTGVKYKNAMPERAKHISASFDAALYGLRNDVLMMSSLTDRIFQTAFEALLNRNSELCDHVVAEDEEIDVLEKQVDQNGVSLLLRFHPVASDMRRLFLR